MKKFWDWYERTYALNVSIAAFLFALQLVHLYWLTAHVVAGRLFGASFFDPGELIQWIIILVDYTEIPAILATSLVYINDLRKKFSWKAVWFLIFLNSQWIHIFWITDEFVLEHLGAHTAIVLPVWLAWAAIFIDYLELPVIFDTLKKAFAALRRHQFGKFLKEDFREID